MIRGMLKSAALGLVVLMAGSALAETKLPSFPIEGVETHQTLSGEKLREALVKNLVVGVNAEAREVSFYAVRMEKGRVADIFASENFKIDPKKGEPNKAFPGNIFFQGDNFFPGNIFFPGDSFFPGDCYMPKQIFFLGSISYPMKGQKEAVAKAAQAGFEKLGSKDGYYMVAIGGGDEIEAPGMAFPKSCSG